jgi:hypothetical protein
VDLLFLGRQPLANSLIDKPQGLEMTVPLTLAFCPDSSLVQIRETVDKEILFSNYVWVSGTSPSTRAYAIGFAKNVIDRGHLQSGDLVIEIASNDGTFLKPFVQTGYSHVLGVDPAANIAKIANDDGIKTWVCFWNQGVAEEISGEYGKARLIFARNVIAHVNELDDFMAGITFILSEDGLGVLEFHYAGAILEGLQYDSIYHEHLCYFSLSSITSLLEKFELTVFHAERSPISGGSLVVFFSKTRREESAALLHLRQKEADLRINALSTWQEFANNCLLHRAESQALVASFSQKTIVGFGASARSSTYLNFCGFTNKHIQAVIDNNPLKQGLYTAGSSLPIVSFQEGLRSNPDFIFIFAWNFQKEIVQECRDKGFRGDFLVAFPSKPHMI